MEQFNFDSLLNSAKAGNFNGYYEALKNMTTFSKVPPNLSQMTKSVCVPNNNQFNYNAKSSNNGYSHSYNTSVNNGCENNNQGYNNYSYEQNYPRDLNNNDFKTSLLRNDDEEYIGKRKFDPLTTGEEESFIGQESSKIRFTDDFINSEDQGIDLMDFGL